MPAAAAAAAIAVWTFWVQPCTPELSRASGCDARDAQLAEWALHAWEKASDGKLALRPAASEKEARIRIYWATGQQKLYGEARPIDVGGQIGAEVYVLPQTHDPAGDALLRDAVVYLTVLHEAGHGFGLRHTCEFADIMFSFGCGGDVPAYFARYRTKLRSREDIPRHSGLSESDAARLRTVVLHEPRL